MIKFAHFSYRKNICGFTLIEILVFIVVSSILMSVILIGATTALLNTPNVHQQWVALRTVQTCMEWFLGQRHLNGYTSLACPSTPTASVCSAPAGYSISTAVSCTTWNSDSTYKTLSITVSGVAGASASVQIGDY
ncbi:MAG: hypothetical protein A3E83_00520 [Gammaproteobacteria bacterium RIFCSPHIGHO2_12_FULL_41_20]|nr:MAG: hypothetical protein A3E83_00520 [Gammaproteobacteria bacterium RIFCSPHIGHO2_12_FULL_41_20]